MRERERAIVSPAIFDSRHQDVSQGPQGRDLWVAHLFARSVENEHTSPRPLAFPGILRDFFGPTK